MKKLLLAVVLGLLSAAAQAQIWVSVPSAWVRMDGGDPAPGGGTGDVATDALWNAAGDLAVGTGPDTATRLAIGANTTVLTSNGTTATWAAAGGGGGAPTTADYVVGTANASLSAEIVAGTGVTSWIATPTSANLRTAMTDETGSSELVFSDSPSINTPEVTNGNVGGGYINLKEDTDNGSNHVRIKGPDNVAANVIATVPNPGYNYTLGQFDGPEQIYLHDDFVCGEGAAAGVVAGCLTWNVQQTTATWAGLPIGTTTAPGVIRGSVDVVGDVVGLGVSNPSSIILMDGYRFRARVKFPTLSDGTDTYIAVVGGTESPGNTTAAPAQGVYFTYTNASTAPAGTPNWTIVVADNGTDTSADCGIAVPADTFQKLDIRYEQGVGVHFLVDGVECTGSPINTDLPTSAGEEIGWMRNKMWKTVGSAIRLIEIDYVTLGPTPFTR